jgi:V/A-type H+-transporting ATPase subunit I
MLKPEDMTKVIIAGSNAHMDATIKVMHAHDAVHITDFVEESDDFKIGKPLSKASSLSERAISLRSIASYLKIKGKEEVPNKIAVTSIEATIDEIIEHLNFEVSKVTQKVNDVDAKIKDIDDKRKLLDPFKNFDISLEMYSGYESLAVLVGLIKGHVAIDEITDNYHLESAPYGRGQVIALFVPKDFEAEVLSALQEQNFTAISIPELTGAPKDLLLDLDAKRLELESEREELEKDLDSLQKKYITDVLALNEYLSIETEKAEAPLRFATTKNAFIVEGWIPTKDLDNLEKDIKHSTNGHVVTAVDKSEAVEAEKVPIALENPLPTKPYEVLIRAFSLPKYNEIDPTTIIFLWYPFFFALMLGDIGYGLVVAALAVLVSRVIKSKGLRALAGIGLYAGILSIVFGFIYNEFFGVELFGHRGLLSFVQEYPALPRFDNVLVLLLATLIIGILHLSLGFVLGFINEYSQHGLKHAVFAKMSWLFMLWGGVVAIALILPPLTHGTRISLSIGLLMGLALAVVGFVLLIMGEGVVGIAELPSLLSNVLSYSRILSIGISSAGIALAVNKLSDALFFSKGGFFIIFGVALLIVGHAVNTALGILDSGLQALRLHYVEFFTKFYRGGGIKYKPFGYKRKYTEEK